MIIDLTGEVVPCCYWSGYGNSGKPLGNTNGASIDEIWRGEGYRALRERVASGDLEGHPCGNCMAYRWGNGRFPKFSWPAAFLHEEGHCYFGQIPEAFLDAVSKSGAPVRLHEDGVELSAADAPHADIRSIGQGRYSVWNGWLYFSSSDNASPLDSGRRYELVSGEHVISLGGLVADSDSGRNLRLAYDEFRRGEANIKSEPSMISLISTADCNIDCPACSQNIVRYSKVQHRPETVPSVLEKVRYLSLFVWHGGEPYLIKRFRTFIDEFKKEDNPNLAFGFTSNGTMITVEEAKKLQNFPRINASVSIDSFNEETFARIRPGASLTRVWENVRKLLSFSNAPVHVFSVGMIICKSNIAELPESVQFAIDHDVGLNLSPVLIYPVVEQLNVFSDFATEAAGWREAVERAAQIVAKAKAANRRAVSRVDPSGMVEELRRIVETAASEYSDVATIGCEIIDPHASIDKMRRPALIAYGASGACAYAKLVPNEELCVLRLPRRAVDTNRTLRIDLVHDVMEPQGTLNHIHYRVQEEEFGIQVHLGEFKPLGRPRNIQWANYGKSTSDGLHVKDPTQITPAYRSLYAKELNSGGYRMTAVRSAGERTSLRIRTSVAQQAIRDLLSRVG